jgi:hypothetical protein
MRVVVLDARDQLMRLGVQRDALAAAGGNREGRHPNDVVTAEPAVAGDPVELRIRRPAGPGRRRFEVPRRGAKVRGALQAALADRVERLPAGVTANRPVEAGLAIPPDVHRQARPPRLSGANVDEDRHHLPELLHPHVFDRPARLDEMEPRRDGLCAASPAREQHGREDAAGQHEAERRRRCDEQTTSARAATRLLDQRLEVFVVLR